MADSLRNVNNHKFRILLVYFYAINSIMARPKYFTPNEVSIHNTQKDLWVSFLGKVYDLTALSLQHQGNCYYLLYMNKLHIVASHALNTQTIY